ncbi:hypothetical protein O6H91_21G040200 [Diphasiastrum complanatum]|uniref:Uncharacterized protein n=1 Tax=Diphasiastrum complanatum TaxID=34168 RepID=A0ACC2AJP8_DIPCM|nr:hypothetical protein O6H91_21G040200 [Diphasiastrum complanatum]
MADSNSATGSRANTVGDEDLTNGNGASSTDLPELERDNAKGVGKLSQNILPHLLNLYNCKSSSPDYDFYAPNATFEDPLMRAHGVKQIKSAFYAIPKIFTEGRMGEYHVQEHETSPGTGEIRIDNVQHYRILGQQIDMKSLIRLQVENGKVVRHEDLWEKRPLWDKETVRVPLVGRLARTSRRGNMLFTHLLMGFGKDPKAKVSS